MSDWSRRGFLLTTGALIALSRAHAQKQDKNHRIGILSAVSNEKWRQADFWQAFLERLRHLGYSEGQNLELEHRYTTDGNYDHLPELANELVQLKVDVLVAVGNPNVLALQQATSTIPIVVGVHESVALGVIRSLSHPGGNITGIDGLAPDMDRKQLQFLREIAPKATQIAALYNPAHDPAMNLHLRKTQEAARILGLTIRPVEVSRFEQFDRAFADLRRERPDGLIVFSDGITVTSRQRIADFARGQRLPSVFELSYFVDSGGLLSYGGNFPIGFRRLADYVHRILSGAKPADLPVEHPTWLELVVNLQTAKQIGVTIPPSILLRADRVIE